MENSEEIVGMMSPTKNVTNFNNGIPSESISEIEKLLSTVVTTLQENIEIMEQDVKLNKQSLAIEKKEKASGGTTKEKGLINRIISKLTGLGDMTGKGGSSGGKGGGGGGKGGGGGGISPFGGNPEKAGAAWAENFHKSFVKQNNQAMGKWLWSFAEMLSGGADPLQEIFHGAVKYEMAYRLELRKIAFQTQGITGDTRGLQKAFTEINDEIETTGVERGQLLAAQARALKRGVIDQQTSLKVNKAALNASTMIGSNAEQTADMFYEWNTQLGFSASQMNTVARGMRQVAQNTGVTGDALLGVAKRSEKILTNMRNIGTLNAQSTKQVMTAMAEATKLGVGDQMAEIYELGTDFSKLLEADTKKQAFMFRAAAGHTQELKSGELLASREGKKTFAQGIEDNIFGAFGTTVEDFKKMTAQEKQILNIRMKSTFGVSANEAEREIIALKKASNSFKENLEELSAQSKKNLSTEKKKQLAQEEENLMLNTGADFLDLFSKQLEDSNSATATMESVTADWIKNLGGEKMGDMEQYFAANADVLKKAGMSTGTDEGKRNALMYLQAKKLGKNPNELLKLARGGPKGMTDMANGLEDLSKALKERDVNAAQGVDPLSQAAKKIRELNAGIRKHIGDLVEKIKDMIGAQGILILKFTAMAASMWFSISAMNVGMKAISMLASGQGLAGLAGLFGGGAVAAESVVAAGTVGTAVGTVAAGETATTAALVSNPFTLPIVIAAEALLGVIGGFYGGFMAATHAAEIFGVTQDKLTDSQRLAATYAGALTGALNFMTFGIFSEWLGYTGELTKGLADFLDRWSVILVPFAFVWGMIQEIGTAIGNMFGEIWKVIKEEVGPPLIELWNNVSETISTLWNDIMSLFGGENRADIDTWIEMGKAFIKQLGTTVGWFVGAVLRPILWLMMLPIRLLNAMTKAAKYVGDLVGTIIYWFVELWDELVGHSIIPDIVNGIIDWFARLPEIIPKFLKKMFKFVFKLLFKLLLKLPGLIFSAIKNIGTWLWDAITNIEGMAGDGPFGTLVSMLLIPLKLLAVVLEYVGKGLEWVWENVVKPVWNVIADGLFWVWDKVLMPAWNAIVKGLKDTYDYIDGLLPGGKERKAARDTAALGASVAAGSLASTDKRNTRISNDNTIDNAKKIEELQKGLDLYTKQWSDAIKKRNAIQNTIDTTLEGKWDAGGVLKTSVKVWDEQAATANINAVKTQEAIEKLTEAGTKKGSIYVHDVTLEGVLDNLLKNQEKSVPFIARPKPLSDIGDTMLRDRTSAESGTQKIKSDELEAIEAASGKQVNHLLSIVNGINELVDILTPSSNTSGDGDQTAADTSLNRRPLHSPQFGLWKYAGKPGSNASRRFVETSST